MSSEPRSILLMLLVPIGDTLFATPAIHGLRRRFPRARITALVGSANRDVMLHNPDVDDLIAQVRGGTRLGFIAEIRRRRFDLMVGFGTFTFWLPWLARIPHFVDLKGSRLWWLLPARDARWWNRHAVQLYLDVVAPLGVTVPEPRLWLEVGAEDARRADELLRALGVADGQLLVAMHAGGEGYHGRKRWPAERFGRAALRLREEWNGQVIVLGGGDEHELAERVVKASAGRAVSAAGRCSLLETAAVIARANLFVGNDSSLLHIASAVGTPAVGIYGTSNERNYHPWQGLYEVVTPLRAGRACYGFVGSQPLWRDHLCSACPRMLGVSVEQVLRAVDGLLRRVQPVRREELAVAGA